jgi:organic hydroperoxide reductase OsmC/OhrA
MSEHHATISWKRESPDFSYEGYNRAHDWRFDAGVEVPASSAPDYLGDPDRVDPEEALVAAVSSCHMLTFLALAARKRLVVERYHDEAVGVMEKNEEGRLAITKIRLRPEIEWGGEGAPSDDALAKLHHQAHEHCFIANSVRSEVSVETA